MEHWHQSKHLTGSSKFGHAQSPEGSPPAAERVDPSLPLEKQVIFVGMKQRSRAAERTSFVTLMALESEQDLSSTAVSY
ncbi:UNVERIFIED_CONTAM: hypothetical protein K2H54_023202 [Gekko kuhli]